MNDVEVELNPKEYSCDPLAHTKTLEGTCTHAKENTFARLRVLPPDDI